MVKNNTSRKRDGKNDEIKEIFFHWVILLVWIHHDDHSDAGLHDFLCERVLY